MSAKTSKPPFPAGDSKNLILDDVAFYGNKADGGAMGKGDLSGKKIVELRTSLNAWAKEQGFETITYKGQRAANRTSANPGSKIDKTFNLK